MADFGEGNLDELVQVFQSLTAKARQQLNRGLLRNINISGAAKFPTRLLRFGFPSGLRGELRGDKF
jgi:hypothetical protein